MLYPSSGQVETGGVSNSSTILGLTWVAYLKLIPMILAAIVAGFLLNLLAVNLHKMYIIYVSGILMIAWVFYTYVEINSVRFIINDSGIWVSRGVLPWRQSCVGMQWRNVGLAGYENNLFTWIFKSYTVNIEDRFTEQIGLSINNLSNGKFAINEINRILSANKQVV